MTPKRRAINLSWFFYMPLLQQISTDQMNEWMCIYIPHISHIVSRRFTILIEWDRTSACKGASGCRYQFVFDLTHPPNPCMKCTMKRQTNHPTGKYVPYSFRQVCGSLASPADYVTLKMQETGPTVYSPYPRRLECLTICWYNYKGNTFSSLILRPWVLVRSGARTIDLPHSRLALYQLS